jgi:hypothetical protein
MTQVARMNKEVWRALQGVDLADRLLQRRGNVSVSCLVEADMAIAYLNEAECSTSVRLMLRHLPEGFRTKHSSAYRPNHAGASPSHALQKTAAVYAVFIQVVFYSTRQLLSPAETSDSKCIH